MKLSARDRELIEDMIEVQQYHAMMAAKMTSAMGKRQYDWDMERVELLRRILDSNN